MKKIFEIEYPETYKGGYGHAESNAIITEEVVKYGLITALHNWDMLDRLKVSVKEIK